MRMYREDCIYAFDNGFVPEISKDRSGIIVTRSSPLISAVSRKGPGSIAFGAALSLAEAGAPKEAAEYLSGSPHWAHLMRLILEMG
jgi:hypothetical protein